MARYIGAILLAALVLWTGEAFGACAWVKWAIDPQDLTRFLPLGGEETKAACEQALTEVKACWGKSPPMLCLCLPDTIDPREPKGAQ
jgi:hypothetical protein